ncbi:MAG TPA: DUF5684 domain-containing protein [Cellulomonas sp.]|nr:DUF5684 domain-containing protein [Cellulomonas sp.]
MHTLLVAAETTTTTTSTGPALIGGLIGYLIVSLGFMGIFAKAGEAGWQGFVPIWNTFVLLKISGKPLWWFVLLLIPIVNIVVLIFVYSGLSLAFGHGAGFTIGLFFFSIIFIYILWLGSSRYVGPGGTAVPA